MTNRGERGASGVILRSKPKDSGTEQDGNAPKSLPPAVGKVSPKATDEENTQKSAELFADQ